MSEGTVYEITTPEFDEIAIALDPRYYPGGEFRIATHDNTPDNVYIQKAKLNGKPLTTCRFPHKDFAGGAARTLARPETQPALGNKNREKNGATGGRSRARRHVRLGSNAGVLKAENRAKSSKADFGPPGLPTGSPFTPSPFRRLDEGRRFSGTRGPAPLAKRRIFL